MRKHSCPGSVKVVHFPGMSEVSGSIPVSGLCFLLIFVVFIIVFTMLFIFVKRMYVQISVVLRPRPRALLIPNLNRTSPASITP